MLRIFYSDTICNLWCYGGICRNWQWEKLPLKLRLWLWWAEFGNEERGSTKTPCSAFDQIGRELGAPWSASVSFIANCLPISQAPWLQHFLIAPKCFWVWTLVVAWLPLGSLFSGGERSVAWWSLVSLERPGWSQGISAQTGFLSKHLCGQAFQLILNRFQAWLQVHLGMLPTPLVSAT